MFSIKPLNEELDTDSQEGRARQHRTIWGLTPAEVHDRFWASRGVCVVRPGVSTPLPQNAELFMLTDERTLAVFPLSAAATTIYWNQVDVLFVRVRQPSVRRYRERVEADDEGQFRAFSRVYELKPRPAPRIAITRDRKLAETWQQCGSSRRVWHAFRHQTRKVCTETFVTTGSTFDANDQADLLKLTKCIVEHWQAPSLTIDGITESRSQLWIPRDNDLKTDNLKTSGTIWIGHGRSVSPSASLLGPSVLWDEPTSRPARNGEFWATLEPTEQSRARSRAIIARSRSVPRRLVRRAFDICFASIALLITFPLYPLIALLILLEDGGPVLFKHRRETAGGREFDCLKFRTMRKDAEAMKVQLAKVNESDGPQFFMKNDPRITRVGRILRATNFDELPQFLNVLVGDMSVVGPRPSPKRENQYCPAWREARLSVKPGVTGLWQVSRTRRQGLDFQEWIRFDIEYVERQGLFLDLWIILKTVTIMFKRG
jgi:lipopolysaccharide/colanic/teichoic acid biosynthesis glycosyltransferase